MRSEGCTYHMNAKEVENGMYVIMRCSFVHNKACVDKVKQENERKKLAAKAVPEDEQKRSLNPQAVGEEGSAELSTKKKRAHPSKSRAQRSERDAKQAAATTSTSVPNKHKASTDFDLGKLKSKVSDANTIRDSTGASDGSDSDDLPDVSELLSRSKMSAKTVKRKVSIEPEGRDASGLQTDSSDEGCLNVGILRGRPVKKARRAASVVR